jgi:hydroxyquinol 1,2-dioxygenase
MIIGNERDVTEAVLREVERTPDPRLRAVLAALVQHLHAFVRDVRLTESEFQHACAFIARLGQATTPSHNEVVLAAGSLGVSSLVCLVNNGVGHTETTANLLGPFWRVGAPATENGGSIVRSPTPGDPIFVTATVVDTGNRPVEGAEVDVWHASTEGLYENQDAAQADMNLRGRFRTDRDGRIRFRSVKPAGYPIPVNGPVGELLRAQARRHNMRPAHLHFLIHKPGYKTQFSQVYSSDDPHLETDVQFGVTRALIGRYQVHDGPAPDADVQGRWHTLEQRFVVEPGEARWPRPPITGKAGASD